MQQVKSIFDFYLNSSLHVAFSAVALSSISLLHFDLEHDPGSLLFVFFGTITGYNFVKYAGIAKFHHISLTKNLRQIQLFSLLCFLIFVYLAFQRSLAVLAITAVMALITVLYTFPILEGRASLRDLSGMKVFIIVFVWSVVTVIVPLVNQTEIFQTDVLLLFLQRYFILLALVLPFEIRDLRYDMARLGTIPQRLGVKRTRLLGMIWIGFFVLLEFLKTDFFIPHLLSVFVVALTAVAVLRFSAIKQSKYFASFWVEAVPVFWWGVLLLLKQLI